MTLTVKLLILVYLALVYNPSPSPPPPLFDLKIVYSYVIEVADSESDFGLHGKALVSEIFAFYHLLKYARGRPGGRGHVHLRKIFFDVFVIYKSLWGFLVCWGFLSVFLVYLRHFEGIEGIEDF